MPKPKSDRKYMRSDLWLEMRGVPTDQQRGVPRPPLQQPYASDAQRIELVAPESLTVGKELSLLEAINQRRSRRKFTSAALTLEELSFLLWATQGVRRVLRRDGALFRTVPSAGARHAFETYLVINRVEGVEPGLYRYLSIEHQLLFLYSDPNLAVQAARACHDQAFVRQSAVTFVWAVIPYRTEWRYAVMAPKLVNLDAGHVCQNLYLAATAIGAGTCAIAAYSQKEMDDLLHVDGEDEFAIYVAPVGKI